MSIEYRLTGFRGTNQCNGNGGQCANAAIRHHLVKIGEDGIFFCMLSCADHPPQSEPIASHPVGPDCDMPGSHWNAERCES